MADYNRRRGPQGPVHVTPGQHSPAQQLPVPPMMHYPMPPRQALPGMMPAKRPTIVVRNLRQSYANFSLSIPQLDIMPGEMTYIGGASGSGKSTLIKILALELVPTSGDLWIMDWQTKTLPPPILDNLRGGGLTYIAQGHLGLIDNTAVQNIQRVLYDYDGVPWEIAAQQAQAALTMVGLPSHLFTQRVKNLSGGEQARVAIAKVYARARPICLADEILPALDEKRRIDVLRLLQRLAIGGFTVVLIAHQPELKGYFHRVIEMRAGQIIDDKRHAPQFL